jgi:hypothetical protein
MLKAALVTDSSIDATECSPGRVSHTARPADVQAQRAAYLPQNWPGMNRWGTGW